AALVAVVIGWVVGYHTPAPSVPCPMAPEGTPPEPGSIGELVGEVRAMRGEVAQLTKDVQRAIGGTQANALKIGILERAAGIEHTPPPSDDEPPPAPPHRPELISTS